MDAPKAPNDATLDRKTTGAWLVHHTNKLNAIETLPKAFGKINVAGKATQLLSALSASADSTLNADQVTALAHATNIEEHMVLPALLDILEREKLLDRSSDGGIHVLGVTQSTILARGSQIFDGLNPSGEERAAIALAEQASVAPIEDSGMAEWLGDNHHLSKAQVANVLDLSTQIGFVDQEAIDASRKLLFNGNLFRRDNVQKVQKVLASLGQADVALVREFEGKLKREGCVLLSDANAMLGEKTARKLFSVGMFDVSVVSNNKDNTSFVTLPAAFSKYSDPFVDDALDLAKALVSSITYGMKMSAASRGQIRMPEKLLTRLINGQWIGPVPAIGEDYKILEMKRVVEIQKEKWGYSMRLLKREVGEVARDVLLSGDASANRMTTIPMASVNSYRRPELQREMIRKKQINDRAGTRDVLLAIRTGRFPT
ncbi:hypothetical protein P3W24_17575 [Luteibacter sp. PPL201]|uniref:Helicase XPB/Ssl2 N-terminal domain-containing protein n=1 Tax=Luteibacter sahnii TaxID=3021977 RepID=A0ABT6BG59_9GAMM